MILVSVLSILFSKYIDKVDADKANIEINIATFNKNNSFLERTFLNADKKSLYLKSEILAINFRFFISPTSKISLHLSFQD